ncbi:MAG: TetR/AcrR family transcriptional regulator [Pseudomonadota bacterium]
MGTDTITDSDGRAARRARIEAAAYAVLEARGYAGTSMLAVAKAARASNETLYRWYGDKTGLFAALIAGNAERVRTVLEDAAVDGTDPIATLDTLGPCLLDCLLGDRAVALNRAAAADPTGELGAVLAKTGRDRIAPMIADVLDRLRADGRITYDAPGEAADLYIALLVGDRQIRRVAAHLPPPSEAERTRIARLARDRLLDLLSPTR